MSDFRLGLMVGMLGALFALTSMTALLFEISPPPRLPAADWHLGVRTNGAEDAAEKVAGWRRHRLTAMDIRVSIVPRAEFEALENEPAYGFTYVDQSPCRVVVPDDWSIEYFPPLGIAYWFENVFHDKRGDVTSITSASETLAHEILHCQIGHWHPEKGD
jgi:hypothetical protein